MGCGLGLWFGVTGLCFRGYVLWVVVYGVLVVVCGLWFMVYGLRLTDLNDDIEDAGQWTHV